jgi:hypothetical protein
VKQNNQNEYLPGQCNIGPQEMETRLRMGYIGLGLIFAFIMAMDLFELPSHFKFLVFIPSAYALSGFLQSQQRFCFLFGVLGLYSITGKRQKTGKGIQLSKDRRRAVEIILQVFFGSLLITLLYYYLG